MSNNAMDITERMPLVAIRCVTYNHEAYIRDALEGFMMQKTNFPFVAIVHDDASTDGTAAIIREYVSKYPEIIKPIIETENQCSKKDGSLRRIMDAAIKETGAKYVAYCEGDDYWTDPLKLQKQVDFMESNPDYTFCFTNASAIDAVSKELKYTFNPYGVECDSPIEDLIMRGGAFAPTATFLLKSQYILNIPKEVLSQYVGDYCIQIYMGYVGKVRYLNINSANYRVSSQGSWTNSFQDSAFSYREKSIWPLHQRLLHVMNCATENKYSKLYEYAMTDFMFWDCRRYGKYLRAIAIYPKLFKPLKRFGWKCIFELFGYGYIKRSIKRIMGKNILR